MTLVLGGAKQSKLMAISVAPSFNYTSPKKDTVAGYTLIQTLDNAIDTVPHTKFNGEPAYVLAKTTQPTCQGDEAGIGGGVKSGTIGKEVKPTSASSTIFIAGRQLVREGDSCTMNNGNTVGKYVSSDSPEAMEAFLKQVEENPVLFAGPGSGTSLPTIPDYIAEPIVGFGDGVYYTITLGMGDLEEIRKLIGSGGSIDRDSGNYLIGNIAGQGYAMLLPVAPKGYTLGSSTVQVAHWAPKGASPVLQPGQWVMIGSNKNVINYLMSGIAGPRMSSKPPFIKNSPYPFKNSSMTEIKFNQLVWPPGMEKWKGVLGQRIYKP